VNFINSQGRKEQAWLVVAKCPTRECRAHFFPDRISTRRHDEGGTQTSRYDILECDAPVLHISKAGLWIDRFIAQMQERLTYSHMSWAGFSSYFNDLYRFSNDGEDILSTDTSKRIFVEHFVRRLIVIYNLHDTYMCPSTCDSDKKVKSLLQLVRGNSAILLQERQHICTECTHAKRYHNQTVPHPNVPVHAVADVHAEVSGLRPFEISLLIPTSRMAKGSQSHRFQMRKRMRILLKQRSSFVTTRVAVD
jgi:hypothetical protein